ncbi:hypothetical protein PsYK624_039940 [Phanerochaete sordida]|uniref:Uncharacterized protein n=1 Tax=Phanerochaete sordida TaxID=48140 RepID=A0A9P3LA23_9APHY|nr:hypothetical protein PsYK624_039940 [Phanerochaete sordida]
MEPRPGTLKPNLSNTKAHPLKGTLSALCKSERTKTTAWNYYLFLKTVREGPDATVLPLGYMSICAFLASEHLGEFDVQLKEAYEKSEVKTGDKFWRNVNAVEEILLEASRNSQSTQPRLHYSRLDTFPEPCIECKRSGLQCYRVQRVKGKRTSKKCMSCFHTSRMCKLPPSRNKHEEEEDELSDDDSDWQPNTTKTMKQRLEKIENRGKKQAQKPGAKRTDCPPLAPFNAPSVKVNPHTTGVAAIPSTTRQSASSSTQPAKGPAVTPMKRIQTKASSSNLIPAQKPQTSPTKAAVKKAAGLPPNSIANDAGSSKAAQPCSQQTPTTLVVDKDQSTPSLAGLRKPGPGRSSQGLVPPASDSADGQPTSSFTAATVDTSPVAGPSSSASQSHTTVRVVKKERLSNASKQSSGRASPAGGPSGTQAPAHPMPCVKQERSASGSGSTLSSAPGRRATMIQAPATSQPQSQASASVPPAPSSQVMRPPGSAFDFGLADGPTSFGSVAIPTSLEPAIEAEPSQRLSSRGRFGASPKTGLLHAEANQAKPRDWTSPKRPSEESSAQAQKRRRISVVDPAATGLPENALSSKITSISAPAASPGTQPTPPQSRKHTPIAGSSASQPSSPMPSPNQPSAPSLPSLVTSQLVREIGELPGESHSSAQTRLPTPISPLSRSATLPTQDLNGTSQSAPRDGSRYSKESSPQQPADPRRSLPTPRSSLPAAIPTPPLSAVEQSRAEPPAAVQDVAMQDASAPPPTPPGARTPQLPSWVQQPAPVPPPASAPPSMVSSVPVPAPVPAPAPVQAPAPLPAPPVSAPSAIPAAAAVPATATVYTQYVQLVYDKAQEILAHVVTHPCTQLELQYAISDMRRRVAKIDERRARGADASAFAEMLLRAGQAVVDKRAALLQRGPLEDDLLDMLVEELEERLADMRRLGGAAGGA